MDLTDPQNPGFVRVSEVCRYFDVDRRTVDKWCESGLLEIHRFPGCDRVSVADIVAFVEKHRPQRRTA